MQVGPIVLTTRVLGGKSGASQAALDVALGLSQRASVLRVRTWVPTRLPSNVDGRALGACEWEPVSPLTAAEGLRTGDAPPRALFEHTRAVGGFLRARIGPRAPAVLEVVNGLGAHSLYDAEKPRPRVRSALVIHESPGHFETPQRIGLAQALNAVRSYDYRVFVSERGQREWQKLADLDPARSTYIPNCVREQRVLAAFAHGRSELRKRYGYAPERMHAVCVGQVTQRKGQDVVLDALRAVPVGSRPVHIDFLGDCSSRWAATLEQRVRSTPFAAQVRFLGNVSDVYERVFAADALILGSRAEAFPLVVLEAMALGVCVVASDVDGVVEQVVDEETGLLFQRENPRELAGCLARVARDARLREKLGAAGRARYLAHFTRERQLARWSSVLQWMQKD